MQHETCISMRVYYGIMPYIQFTDSNYLESCPIFNSLIHVCLSVSLDQTKLFNLLYVKTKKKKTKSSTIGLKIHDALHKFKTAFEPHQGQLSIGLLRTITPKTVHVLHGIIS